MKKPVSTNTNPRRWKEWNNYHDQEVKILEHKLDEQAYLISSGAMQVGELQNQLKVLEDEITIMKTKRFQNIMSDKVVVALPEEQYDGLLSKNKALMELARDLYQDSYYGHGDGIDKEFQKVLDKALKGEK